MWVVRWSAAMRGISPNAVVNRATVTSPDRGEEVPLDVLAAAQPAKLYILIGSKRPGPARQR